MKILGIGDVIGSVGRDALRALLPALVAERGVDVVVANAENSAGGLGTTPETAADFFALGVHVHHRRQSHLEAQRVHRLS